MSESMIERVATALADFYNDGLNVGAYRPAASAAIEAMREPTDAMVTAGGNAQTVNARANRRYYFRNMIDQALNEQVSG